ncbi:MAG: Crp/Fnr family transcriptional regulator [Desulfotomaculaceae bacterium]|nr:Crp/Fnr family transcriptional regulator [Desulfotomaculaceae bacterium]
MLNHNDTIYLQEHLPFFKKLDEAYRRAVVAAASKVAYERGKIILSKEKECNGLVIVKSGQLRAFFEAEDGKEITLYRLLSNDICILTASCAIKNITFDVTLEAEKDSVLYIIPAAFWGNLIEKNIFVKEFSMELVSGRFSEVMWVMEQMVSKNMRQRIATFLLEQLVLEESDTLSITHETIAKNLGTAREVISRILKYFENDSIIRLSRGQIHIVDIQKLKEMLR